MKLFVFLLSLFSLAFAQGYLFLGYGSYGFRFGWEKFLPKEKGVRSLVFWGTYLDDSINQTFSFLNQTSYSFKERIFSLNFGYKMLTNIDNLYIKPFFKMERYSLKNDALNYSKNVWRLGGGLEVSYEFKISKYLCIEPGVSFFYIQKKDFYYNNTKIEDAGEGGLKASLYLNLNLEY